MLHAAGNVLDSLFADSILRHGLVTRAGMPVSALVEEHALADNGGKSKSGGGPPPRGAQQMLTGTGPSSSSTPGGGRRPGCWCLQTWRAEQQSNVCMNERDHAPAE